MGKKNDNKEIITKKVLSKKEVVATKKADEAIKEAKETVICSEKVINCSSIERKTEKKCDSWNNVVDLSWPMLTFVFVVFFWKKIGKILDGLGELIPKIKSAEVAGITVNLRNEEAVATEFLNDIESVKDLDEEPTPIKKLNDAYKEYQKQKSKDAIKPLAMLKVGIMQFENKAIQCFEKNIIHRPILRGVELGVSGKRFTIDGLFVFEGTLFLVEVKYLKNINSRVIESLINNVNMAWLKKEEFSKMMNLSIIETRGLLILPKGTTIGDSAKSLIDINKIQVNYYDEVSDSIE